ncbi:hypothetical protein [Bdellovibrio sp. NC01]|uniref:hypothetical protein n=1 Tax=Bdellovibrio sp. NC01 TaxID=2220073 RepID=UPI0011580CA0|nr:hypothetical protein [Bdellovibrio sp. NC01]QDK38302.1 hypothetical protein DOE51_12300 [Bdellovibrio sp. NC01]
MFNVRYVLLSPHHTNEQSRRLLNQTYESWKKTFNQVLGSADAHLELDDFFRYDMIGVLLQGDSIIGSHYYSLFNLELDCCLDHHYMDDIYQETRDKLKAAGHKSIYSLEYTNIVPEWRKRSMANIRWVDVLIGCALKFLDESPEDGIIGTPRIDIKMDETTSRMGALTIQPPVKKMNYECAVIYWPKLSDRKLYSPELQRLVDSIWSKHEDFLMPKPEAQPVKKIA